MTRLILFLLIWLGCCGYALWRGGAPERLGALVLLSAGVISAWVQDPAGSRFDSVEAGILVVDIFVFLAFLAVAIASTRYWPLVMCGMQGVQIFSHAAILINAEILPWAYWNAQTLWSYPMLLLLAIATARHRRRKYRGGSDLPWKYRLD